jgi:hypothetical protein
MHEDSQAWAVILGCGALMFLAAGASSWCTMLSNGLVVYFDEWMEMYVL